MSEANANDFAEGDNSPVCRILSLDGGGAKGFYTLGVLKELEGMLGSPLCKNFDLIFGTSTGAIIAALLALEKSADDIHRLYKEHVPSIMRQPIATMRTSALKRLAKSIFGDLDFSAFKTRIGIVATHWELEKPMIFKTNLDQAHGRKGTFLPGFGCTIADAVIASCSAYPFFERPKLQTSQGDAVEVADGGFCANNPTLYAIADAVMALKHDRKNLRVISIGVGSYPDPKYPFWKAWLRKNKLVQLLQKTLNVNTCSMEQLRQVLFKDVPTIRISETFSKPELATDLMEHNLTKLDLLYQRGRDSFAPHEIQLRSFFGIEEALCVDT
ncbi:MAG: patatin-like phospholipase family protein [bacterium]